MGRLFGWVAGLVGIAALGRVLARRSRRRSRAGALPVEDPAEALRVKLARARAQPPVTNEPSATERETESAESEEALAERRARVHAKAQEAIEAMDALQEQPQ